MEYAISFFCAEDIIGADMVQFGKFYDVSGREWQFVELIEGISLLGDAEYHSHVLLLVLAACP